MCDSDHKLSATDNGGVLHPTAAKEARVKLNTEFTGLISFQLVLVLVAVVLVANPLSMLLFIHLSFTRTVYLLLFDTLIAAAVFYAVRHIRRGRRRDLVGAFGLLIALPVVMLLAEPAIVAMTERMAVSDAPENEVSAGSSIHRPDPLLGWVPVPGATGRHAIALCPSAMTSVTGRARTRPGMFSSQRMALTMSAPARAASTLVKSRLDPGIDDVQAGHPGLARFAAPRRLGDLTPILAEKSEDMAATLPLFRRLDAAEMRKDVRVAFHRTRSGTTRRRAATRSSCAAERAHESGARLPELYPVRG